MSLLQTHLDGETGLTVVRPFRAPPDRVWDAHFQPDLARQWLGGYEGWHMTDCTIDLRSGGSLRMAWAGPDGAGFHLLSRFLAVEPKRRTLHVEQMFLPDPTPENRIETLFEDDGAGGTRLTLHMQVPDAATRTAMLDTGMLHGMEWSYARIDPLLGATA
jgi:uncharacterized protein YndB with AHSA1/START domain